MKTQKLKIGKLKEEIEESQKRQKEIYMREFEKVRFNPKFREKYMNEGEK